MLCRACACLFLYDCTGSELESFAHHTPLVKPRNANRLTNHDCVWSLNCNSFSNKCWLIMLHTCLVLRLSCSPGLTAHLALWLTLDCKLKWAWVEVLCQFMQSVWLHHSCSALSSSFGRSGGFRPRAASRACSEQEHRAIPSAACNYTVNIPTAISKLLNLSATFATSWIRLKLNANKTV